MAGNPDFRLIVGADVNLSYQQMKEDLNEVIKRLGSDPVRVKVGLDQTSAKGIQKEIDAALSNSKTKADIGLKFDTSAFKDFQDKVTNGLGEISRLVSEISNKNLGLNLNISDANTAQEQIAGVRGEVLAYAKALEQAQSEVLNLYSRKFGRALAEEGADLGKAVGVIVNYRTELSRITESIDKQNTLTGLKVRRDELEQLRAAIVPVIEAANKLGATNFDIKRLIPTEIPANVASSADKVSELFSKLGAIGGSSEASVKQQTEAIAETVRVLQDEMRKVTEVSEKYDAHKMAVEAAAQAEAAKARESSNVAGALKNEEAATDMATNAAKKHAKETQDSAQASADVMSQLLHLQQKIGSNTAKQSGLTGSDVKLYQELEEQINRDTDAFDKLYQANEKVFSSTQLDKLSQGWQDLDDKASIAGAKAIDKIRALAEEHVRAAERVRAAEQEKKAAQEAAAIAARDASAEANAQKQVDEAYKRTLETLKQLGNARLEIQKAKFSGTDKDVEAAIEKYKRLKDEYTALRKSFVDAEKPPTNSTAKLSAQQSAGLTHEIERQRDALITLKDTQARMDYARLGKQAEDASHEFEKLRENINKISDQSKINTSDIDKLVGLLQKAQDAKLDNGQRQTALNEFNALLKTTASNVAALTEQEKKAAQEAAALQKVTDSIGAYEARFSKIGESIAHMGGAPSKELEAAYDRLRSLLNTMKSDTSSEQDKINASKDWAKAVQEVTERVSAEEQVYTRAKQAEAQAAREQAQAAKEEAAAESARVKEQGELSAQAEKAAQSLERLYESTLKISDGTKLSTEDLNKMIDLLRQAQDVTLDPSQRQAALNEFNKILESTTFKVEELIRAEKEEAEAAKQAEQEKKRAYAAEVQKQNLLKQAQSLLQRVTNAQQNWTKAASNSATRDAYNGLAEYKTRLNEIISALNSGKMAPEEFRVELAKLNSEFAKSSSTIQGAGSAVKGYFGRGLDQLRSRLSYTFGFAAIVTKTVAEVRKMISTAVELDTAMNNLQIVTRGSNDDMAAYGKTVSQMAKETAQSTKDLIDATTVYARLGYTMDESATLAKYTAQLQNVGSIEASAAQDAMTAIIKAFHKDVDDVESVMDKLVTVGKRIAQSCSNAA